MKIQKAELEYKVEDNLELSYGKKLRGFFANKFKNVLFHNHKENDSFRYQYPLIQYKILNGNPFIIGINEGAILIVNNFLDIDQITLGDKVYDKPEGIISMSNNELKVEAETYKYKFITPWRGLNDKNFKKYKKLKNNHKEQDDFLNNILIGNILSFAKGIDWWIEEEIKIKSDLEEIPIYYKGNKMSGFKGDIKINIKLPDYIGLGKSPSRGFGTIKRINQMI
ncbi:MAG: CRISPR-associated endonuclease Cas6 [Candidatus Woesearchaeota archaeon]